jgi:thymidylate kinase
MNENRKVAVVGHCAAGKSTVVKLLRELDVDAYAVAQEHSIIRDLWRRQQPDFVLYLDVSLEELRRRRNNAEWPSWIFTEQERRLADARQNATLIVDTDNVDPEDVVRMWQEAIDRESP